MQGSPGVLRSYFASLRETIMMSFFLPVVLVAPTPQPEAMTWTPKEAALSTRVTDGDPITIDLLRVDSCREPADFGLEWPEPVAVGEVTALFAALGGRVYEPDPKTARVQVWTGQAWQPVEADLETDYTGRSALAPLQQRGSVVWRFRFRPVRTERVRVYCPARDAPNPGYECIALVSLSASPGDSRPRGNDAGGGRLTVRGSPPRMPDWLAPGADLTMPGSGAEVTPGSPYTIRWPKPLMLNAVRYRPAGRKLASVEYLAGNDWRPVEPDGDAGAGYFRFLPVAAAGLRLRFRNGAPERVSVCLDDRADAYFQAVRESRTDMLTDRFSGLRRRDLAAMGSLLLPIDFTKAAIGRPADLQETMVSWTGTFWQVESGSCVDMQGKPLPAQPMDRWFTLAVGRAKTRVGEDWAHTRSHYLDEGLPAVVTDFKEGGVEYTQTLFVTAPGAPLYGTVALVRVRNTTPQRVETQFTYGMGRRRIYAEPGEPVTPLLSDPQPTGYRLDSDRRTVRSAAGEIVFWSVHPGRWEGTLREGHFVVPLRLTAGEERALAFFVPCVTEPLQDASRLKGFRADRLLAGFRTYWRNLLANATQLDIPEPPFNALYRNLLAQCLIIGLDGDEVRYGAYHYESYFGVEEGWPAVALAQYGLGGWAQKMLDYMLSPVCMDKTNYHHQYRNGLAAWYAVSAYRLTGDIGWLRKVAPVLQANAEWTIRQTEENRGPDYGGILPRHAYGGDISMPAYSFYSNAACWRGLHDTASAFAALGDKTLAARYYRAAEKYRARLLELADRLVDRSTVLPFLPMSFHLGSGENAREKEPAYPFLANDVPGSDTWRYLANYWNLFAPLFLELRLFDPRDPRAAWVPRYMEERGGALAGQARFASGLDAVYGKGYVESLLEQGRRDRFIAAFYGLFAHAMSRNLYSAPEVSGVWPLRASNRSMLREYERERWYWVYRYGGSWTGGWQNQEGEPLAAVPGMALQILRMALVREDYATDPPAELRLLDGAPAHWFEPGKRIAARGMRTFFGSVSFEVQTGVNRCAATVEFAPGFSAVSVVLRLPHTAGRPLRRVLVNGSECRTFAAEEITLPAPRGRLRIDAAY
jgi:hypothetical protein